MEKNIMSKEYLQKMLEHPLLEFTDDITKNDNTGDTLHKALALFSLALQEHTSPEKGAVAERVAEHLKSVVSENHAPTFDAICLWSYCVLSASIALAQATPSIWEKLDFETKERLTFMMEVYSYLECFATSDENSYKTGPGLSGNYHKSWNPNYRLANVPVMIFATQYFGHGNIEEGCKIVNDMLHGFNEEVYDRVINGFQKYGWKRAFATWTTPARTHEDGTKGTDARHVLLYGGTTYTSKYEHTPVTKDSGNGLGVTNGGKDYSYHGYALSEVGKIIKDLLEFNYSGGEVKSDHHYDVDKDGIAERVAWIVGELTSPYQGKLGMMLEFASGNRSSTGYCSHDFLLTTCLIATSKALGLYDATKDTELWNTIKIGNEDFLFKNENGYQCFSTGSYGTSAHIHSEKNEGNVYFAIKSLWKTLLCDQIEI